ncbi:hypothetical protein [Schlesneria sp. T3-172]|uniref:hypothetical protein n=1 Tax=Schlesneria sphaerica TaxID=3373610 RepID=UPI0037CBC49B
MPHTVEPNEKEQFVVRLLDEPPFIHSLMMSPAGREAMLDSGDWLVLAFAVWSINDQPSITHAIEFAKSLDGRLNLGLRPFESAEEFGPWCDVHVEDSSFSDVSAERTTENGLHVCIKGKTGSTPIWICFRDGVAAGEHHGLLDKQGLQEFTTRSFQ